MYYWALVIVESIQNIAWKHLCHCEAHLVFAYYSSLACFKWSTGHIIDNAQQAHLHLVIWAGDCFFYARKSIWPHVEGSFNYLQRDTLLLLWSGRSKTIAEQVLGGRLLNTRLLHMGLGKSSELFVIAI